LATSLPSFRHLGRESEEDILRLDSPIAALGVNGENDAVIPKLDLDESPSRRSWAHSSISSFLILREEFRDVDRGVAEALAETA